MSVVANLPAAGQLETGRVYFVVGASAFDLYVGGDSGEAIALRQAAAATLRAQIEALIGAVGPASAPDKTVGVDTLPAGATINGETLEVAGANLTGWDASGYNVKVLGSSASAILRDMIFTDPATPVGANYPIEVETGATDTLIERPSVRGTLDAEGSSTLILIRAGAVRTTLRGALIADSAADALKIDGIDTVMEDCVFLLPFNVPAGTPNYDPGVTYAIGDLVLFNSRIWRKLTTAPAGTPPGSGAGDTTDWDNLDRHVDLISLTGGENVVMRRLLTVLTNSDGRIVVGPTQVNRNVRNTAQGNDFGPIMLTGMVLEGDWPGFYPFAIGPTRGRTGTTYDPGEFLDDGGRYWTPAGAPVQNQFPDTNPELWTEVLDTNAPGPVEYSHLWITSGTSGYFHPDQIDDGEVPLIWHEVRDADTDAVIAPPKRALLIPRPEPTPGVETPAVAMATSAAGAAFTIEPTAYLSMTDHTGAVISACPIYAEGMLAGWITEAGVAVADPSRPQVSLVQNGAVYDLTLTAATGDPLPGRIRIPAPAAATVALASGVVPVTSASLRFPDANPQAASGDMAFLRAANFTSAGNPIWDVDGAWLATVEIPAESLSAVATGDYHKARSVIFGNANGGTTNGGTMALSVEPPTNSFAGDGSEHGALHFFWRDAAGISEATLPIGDHRRLLFVMRLNGAAARIEAYAEGALVAGADVATPAADDLRSGFAIGCDLNFTDDSAASKTSAGGFDGAVGMIGFVEASVSAADCEAISAGVDPLSLHAEANWRFYRRLTGTDATSLAAAASGDVGADLVAVGAGFRPGSDIVPVRSGAGWMTADYVPAGRVWGAASGATTATITLSGMAAGLTGGVEARYYDSDGTLRRNWTALAGADLAAGAWSGTMTAPLGAGWGHVDVRAAAEPSLIHATRIECGVGYHVAALGQSQVSIALAADDLGLTPGAGVALSMARQVRVAGTPQTGVISLTPVSAARPVSDGVAALADLFAGYTAAPVCLMAFEHAGTGMAALTDDADAARAWADLDAMAALAGAKATDGAGGPAIAMNWSNNNASPNNIVEDFFAPMLTGVAPASAAHAIDHHFEDGTFAAGMVFAISPITRFTTNGDAGPQDFSGGNTGTRNAALARAGLLAYAAAEGLPVGPFVDDIVIEPAGGPHQDGTTPYGAVRTALRMGVAMARALGLDASVDPAIASVVRSGARLTATVTRPGGGDLQTAWALAGVTPPAGWPEVQGFEVSIDGGTTWSNGRDGAPVTFDAVIADAAAGVVHIDRTGGETWPANTAWRYAANGPVDYGTGVESLRLVHGLLYEAGPLEGGIGLPVKGLAEGVAAATTVFNRQAAHIGDPNNPDTPGPLPSRTVYTMRFNPLSNGGYIFGADSTAFTAQLLSSSSDLRIKLEDPAGGNLIDNVVYPGVLTSGVMVTMVVDLDMAGGTLDITVDGVSKVSATFAVDANRRVQNRPVAFFSSSVTGNTLERIECEFVEVEYDGVLRKRIDAADLLAGTDPWVRGAWEATDT